MSEDKFILMSETILKSLEKRVDRLEKIALHFEPCCEMPPRIDMFTYAKDGEKAKEDDPYHITCMVCNHTVRGLGIIRAFQDWNQSLQDRNVE